MLNTKQADPKADTLDLEAEIGRPGVGAKRIKVRAFLKIGDEEDVLFERGGVGIEERNGIKHLLA